MSVRRSLVWSYGGQMTTLVVTFTTSIVVARSLAPREMGIYALAVAVSGVLGVFLTFGTQAYLVREEALDPRAVRSAFTVNLLLSLILSSCLAIAGLAELAWQQSELAIVFFIMAIGPLFSAFEFIPVALFMRDMRYDVISAVSVLRAITTAVVTLSFVLSGSGAPGLAVGPVAANLLCSLTFMLLRRRDLVFRPGFYQFRTIMVFGVQMLSISGVAQLAQRSSDIILGQMLGLAALGLYARASGLATLIFLNVYGLATGVIFVQLSRDLREKGEMHQTFVRALRMITGAMWPLLIGIAVLAGPLVLTLYGTKWLPAALPLALLMIAQFIVLGFGMNWELFVLRQETGRQTKIEFTRAAIGTIIFAIGCMFGIAAAALGRIGEALVGYILYRPHIDRLAGTAPGEIRGIYAESLQLTAVAVAPSVAVMAWWHWSPHVPLPLAGAAIMLGILGWFAILHHKRHPIAQEVMLLARTIRRSVPARGGSD